MSLIQERPAWLLIRSQRVQDKSVLTNHFRIADIQPRLYAEERYLSWAAHLLLPTSLPDSSTPLSLPSTDCNLFRGDFGSTLAHQQRSWPSTAFRTIHSVRRRAIPHSGPSLTLFAFTFGRARITKQHSRRSRRCLFYSHIFSYQHATTTTCNQLPARSPCGDPAANRLSAPSHKHPPVQKNVPYFLESGQ